MKQAYPSRALTVPEEARQTMDLDPVKCGVFGRCRAEPCPGAGTMNIHVFARIDAGINSLVSLLLLAGLFTAKAGNWSAHRRVMLTAMVLSICFLISYILHHLFAGDTRFGGTGAGIRTFYYIILATHILLAGGSLPFILLTAYRALSTQYPHHRKLAKRVWPVWFYVSVTGVVVYFLISPYY